MRIGSYVQALCTVLGIVRAAPRASERSLPHGAVATRDARIGAGRGVRGFFAGPERAIVGLETDESWRRLQNKQDGFSLLPTCTCLVHGRVPRPEYCYIAN